MKQEKLFEYHQNFELESGEKLPGFQLQYTTFGHLNPERSNVIWVLHAFSGSSDFTEWWSGLFGEGRLYDPSEYYVICANMPGSCYGSTGPLSINPKTKKPYYHDFPLITNRDIVLIFDELRKHLNIRQVNTIIGCSLGGQQAVEWAILRPGVFENLISIGSNAQHSPWAIAFNETQRMSIEADSTWKESNPDAGINGMKAARAAALLSYRNSTLYNTTQSEVNDEKFDDFKASSYQQYQGEKMAKRFNAFSYWYLSKAMDSQNVGRGRKSIISALQSIEANSLFIGIGSDILFPTEEQKFMTEHVPNSHYIELNSKYGHDGFLLEFKKLTRVINEFYKQEDLESLAS